MKTLLVSLLFIVVVLAVFLQSWGDTDGSLAWLFAHGDRIGKRIGTIDP